MDHAIRQRAPFTVRNKNTEQECDFHDQSEVDNFLANLDDAADWHLLTPTVHIEVDLPKLRAAAAAGAAAEAKQETEAAPEAPATAPTVTEAPAAPARKPRAAKK